MKCILNPTTGEIKRLSEAQARNYVKYGWQYTSKSRYKAWLNKQGKAGKPPAKENLDESGRKNPKVQGSVLGI